MFVCIFFIWVLILSQSEAVSLDEDYEDFDPDYNDFNGTSFGLKLSTDLAYHFYCTRHPTKSIKVEIGTISRLKNTNFSAEKETLFIVHGWKCNNVSQINREITAAILKNHDINVIVVDWSKMAGKNYISAKRAVTRVGLYVAGFITELKANFGLRLEKVKFVGHSLGAHICGNAGAALGGKVDRIVGLDPAGPLFTVKNTANRLDRTDAKFVQVIHTNGGTLGFGEAIGHADYFPNGGESQPGCGWDLVGTCSHSRAYAYYSESLQHNFLARRCTDIKQYKKGNCKKIDVNDFSVMGRFTVDYNARGSYYLLTNSKPPYARG
ncbi:unnamed protein product [Diabrotica balteata]|uniref:Lipase domain-containing protein n=1 Tax=Diabrotica balteata TaxID=107213 RepID=A0A9P0E189_DIABA|nr:unnamed protein product [Diabrotica balteata]